jgi:glycine/D-amino acid oxidase-like deaminating enzyme
VKKRGTAPYFYTDFAAHPRKKAESMNGLRTQIMGAVPLFSTRARSFWLQEALERERTAGSAVRLEGDRSADVCIVGGGYTGLWTALCLKELEPALDVVLIEAGVCGRGASGANGGFLMTWMSKATTLIKTCGDEESRRLLRASEDAVGAIERFCRDHAIDCHFHRSGWLWTATNAGQMDAWGQTVDLLDRLDLHPFEMLSRHELARHTGSQGHAAGLFERNAATVQPALLVRGLRRVALEKGVRLHEQSPMTKLRVSRHTVVQTDGGTVRAEAVVLATNAWAHGMPGFRRVVLPVAADALVTAPIPERLAPLGLSATIAVSDSRLQVIYYRTTLEGRMSFGQGGGGIPFAGRVSRLEGPAVRTSQLRGLMRRFYPSLGDVPPVSTWRAPATRTENGLPLFGRLPDAPSVFYGFGYTGNGVGPSYLGGRILASLILDRRDEWSLTPLARPLRAWLPREPFRFLGGRLIRRAAVRKDQAEDEGRRASWIDRRLTGFIPVGLAPVKQNGD